MRNYLVSLMMLLALASCKQHVEQDEQSTAFTMSDTMMKKCQFATVTLDSVQNELRLFGKIEPNNNQLAEVTSVVGGVVETINVELGDFVTKGQVLAVVRSGEIAAYQKEKLAAQSDVAVAEKNLQVARDMFAGKLASEKDVKAAEREMDIAKAELSRIDEVYKIYNLSNGSTFNITAPISGFIVQKNITPNEQIRADAAEVLYSIAQIDEVWAMANVNESDISKVQIGYSAAVRTLSFPDDVYRGRINKIFNAIDPETKAMKVQVRIPNSSYKLKPEMNITVTVHYSENQTMCSVPASAVIFDRSKNWVMVFKSRSEIETRQVEVYRSVNDTAYIANGINCGEKVISKNGLLIYDALND